MSKLRRKFMTVLAVLFFALLALSAVSFIPKTKTASAATRSGSWTEIGEIYTGNGGFDAKNMQKLYATLTGNKDATYEDVANLVRSGDKTSQEIRNKNNGNNVSVTFGGIQWDATYLTKDTEGNIILDLWQSATVTLGTSKWSNSASNTPGDAYPSSMYSTSLIRVETLNAGGYASDNNRQIDFSLGKTAKKTSNKYAKFTMTKADGVADSLTDYIVLPKKVNYQKDEYSMTGFTGSGADVATDFNNPNDAWDRPAQGSWHSDYTGNYNYTSKGNASYPETLYGAWQNDYLWLPSLSETGRNMMGISGIWKANGNLRASGTSASSPNIWLRSGSNSNASKAASLTYEGVHTGETYIDTNNPNLAVRPAIHFNLTASKTLYMEDVETTYTGSDITLDTIYNANADEIPWYIPNNVYSTDLDYEYKLNGLVSPSILNVGTYETTMTFKSIVVYNYKWDANNTSSTINITVKEKPVKVKFTKGAAGSGISDGYSVTSGDTANYPYVSWYDTNQIASTDTGDRCPDFEIRYFSKKESKYLSDGEVPVKPGDYTLYVDLKYAETAQYKNYKLDPASKTSIDFTVKPVEVKAPSLSGESGLVYDGNEHTITIADYSTDIKYTVYKDGSPIDSLVDVTAQTFNVKDAGTYTVTFAFDDEKKDSRVWKGTTQNDPFDADDFTVKQAELTITLSGDSDFGKGSWGKGSKKEFTISISGAVPGEEVQLSVYFTKKDGSGRQSLTEAGGKYTISESLDKGDYILYCELTDPSSGATDGYKKENYVIKYDGKDRVEKSFTIGNSNANFDESELKWVYSNADIDGGAEKDITSGTHLTYNGNSFTVTLKSSFNDLAEMGVKIDGSISGATSRKNANGINGAETEYVIKIKLVALSEDYNFEDKEIEFKWYIDKATYTLADYTPEWSYKARGNTKLYPESGVQYEGGTAAGENGYIEILISSGLPDSLVPIFDVGYRQSAVGKYTLHITGFTNNDPNYNDITSIPAGVTWINFNWEIVKRTISTAAQFWSDAEYSDGEVTKGPALKTSPYNPKLKYEYFEDADCSGPALTLDQIEYEEGVEKTYYVRLSLELGDAGNWILSPDSNPHGFTIGSTKTAVEITIKGGGVYDGTSKEVEIAIVGEVEGIDLDAFEITYYGADGEVLAGAPSDAGTYSVAVALKEEFADSYYIKGDKTYDLVISTRVLEVPKYDGTLTYNGNEQDIAKLAGLPDGWENYIEITINGNAGSKVKDVGTYNFIFKIKQKDIDAGNVAWNTTSNKTQPRTLQVTVNQLVLHAKKWIKNGYYTALEFAEEDGDKFVTYTVRNANGDIVTEEGFYADPDAEYEIEVFVAEEHGDNVKIEYAGGVNPKLKFIGSSTNEGDAAELEKGKNSAKEELEKEAKAKKDAIESDNNLTAEEKAAAKDEIDRELEEGKDAIDKATDLDGVKDAFDAGKKEIDDTADLAQKKGAAKSELDKAAQAKKDEIDNNKDLTDEEKAAAKSEVDKELEAGKKAIDGATDVSEVQSAESVSKTIIENIKPKHAGGPFPWWIIAVIGGALLLLALLIIIIVKRRQVADGEDEYDDYYDDEYDFDEEGEYEEDGDFGDEEY